MAEVTRTTGNGVPSGEISPEEAASIRAAVTRKEQAPSSRVQAAFSNWREVADILGSPFEVERIPISKLRAMRRDPMLGFGLSFTKMPHVRAKWYINARSPTGPNAQISAHLDHDLRRIYASFVLQCLNSLDFGFQAIAKRFELRRPSGTYIATNPETGEQEERPIWDEGNVEPIGWKPFVALRPEGVEPVWNNLGEFDGITYAPGGGGAPGGIGATRTGGGAGGTDKEETFKIDLYHSLWFTHEKDANFGSIFGYPRLGYAYRYWWSYWFRWAMADRAFEKKADPSVLVRHPDGEFVDENTGERMRYSEYALLMGERMRSGGVIALPSEVYEDANGRGTLRQWDIEFTKDAVNFEPFDKSFEYLDVQKLRSLFIPEQAFFEGKGGTSSRNVAAEMGEAFIESQAVLSAQIIEHINRFLIPQWLAVNYPEFVVEGGTAEIIMQGFADEDVAFTNQVISLIGQQESGMKEILKLVDLKRLLSARGTPIADFGEQQRRERQMAEEAAAQAPPATAPIPGQQVGVVPTGTGFSYIEPREVIHLAETGTDFIENLPNTPHYEDKAVKGFSRRLWNVYRDLYEDEYETIISEVENSEDEIALSDHADVELAVADYIDRATELIRRIGPSRRWASALNASANIFESIMKHAGRKELRRARLKGTVDQEAFDAYLSQHIAEFAPKVAETTRNEVRNFMANKLRDGITDKAELARMAREHFMDFPKWKADRLVRTEVRDVYNAATLLAAREAGIELVQALDAQHGDTDPDCMERDGRIFTVDEALREDEHPNGTLGWKIVPVKLSIERVDDEQMQDRKASLDLETNTVQLRNSISKEDEASYLKFVVDHLIAQQEFQEEPA